MFRKREDIERDFIQYGTQPETPRSQGSILGKLIQLLSLIVLLGIVLFMGLFGYRYWQKEFTDKEPAATPAVIPTAQSAVPQKRPAEKKLYTQEEMQMIVKMLTTQMADAQKAAPTNSGADATDTTATAERATPSGNAATDEPAGEADSDALMQALEDVHIDLPPEKPVRTANAAAAHAPRHAAAQKVQPGNDHYNKVVVKPSKNSYDDLTRLSKQIGSIVDTMQQKSTSDYTRSIKKELTTRSKEMRVIVVKPGDTLSSIAKRAYGSAMAFDIIMEANPDLIKNPNHIYVGQRLRVPLKQ